MNDWPCLIAASETASQVWAIVRNPYTAAPIARVPMLSREHLDRAIERTRPVPLSRHDRSRILLDAADRVERERAGLASLITSESGLCRFDTDHEVDRALDVLRFAAAEALRDDAQVFSCDVTKQQKNRKIYTLREPLALVAAITPFNHPLNQAAHKLAPAIAAGTPIILKPSEKTPLSALRLATILYDAGLPPTMLSVIVGSPETIAEPLVAHARVEGISFTGSTRVGHRIASIAGPKKLCLELGGNSPLIILADADLDLAVRLAAEGSYRNSGQRCTAVKRILVHESIARELTERLVEETAKYPVGDPTDPATRVGTVIDEHAATRLTDFVRDAQHKGAIVRTGGENDGALMPPTVLANVPRNARLMHEEAFGPLAPIVHVRDLDDAIHVANDSPFGLAAAVVTNRLDHAIEVIKRVRTGTVNVNDVPGYRLETSPFGGLKNSGLGIKEGVCEATRWMTNTKAYSLPW